MTRIITRKNMKYFARRHAGDVSTACDKLKEKFRDRIRTKQLDPDMVKLLVQSRLEAFPARKGHYVFSVMTGMVVPAADRMPSSMLQEYADHLQEVVAELSRLKPLTDYITINTQRYQPLANENLS